jgi:hypothetical protein
MHRGFYSLLLVTTMALAMPGCAATVGETVSRYDKFRDAQTDIVIISPDSMQLARYKEGSAPAEFALVMPSLSSGRSGPSRPRDLILIADAERIALRGTSELDDVIVTQVGVLYRETAFFPVSADVVRKLAQARRVEYRLYMSQADDVQGAFTEPMRQAVRQFYQRFVAPHAIGFGPLPSSSPADPLRVRTIVPQ